MNNEKPDYEKLLEEVKKLYPQNLELAENSPLTESPSRAATVELNSTISSLGMHENSSTVSLARLSHVRERLSMLYTQRDRMQQVRLFLS